MSSFFQTGPLPLDQMTGLYDIRLVILSYLVATFASYIALDFTGRLRDVGNTRASVLFWLLGGSIAMGAGIWSMHFIGMLSFTMPMMTLQYDLFLTGLSLFVAILASSFALFLLKSKTFGVMHLAVGGIILGLAIASMHYTGMEAMKIVVDIHYLPGLFFLSILIAIIASEAALWLALKSNQVISRIRIRLKVISASIMGLAICGMHYTGMAAAVFTHKQHSIHSIGSLDPTILSISIAGVTFVILGIAFFASTYKEALNQQQLETARQLGMAEVAASVLHNVGNVLNSVNVSVTIITDKIHHTKLKELENLRMLLNEHQHDLNFFITQDARGSKVPDFINKLTDYWHQERHFLTSEMDILSKNIQHIKDIIALQQDLARVTTLEQMIAIEETLEEALLITNFVNNSDFIVEKNYEPTKPILIDKVKILQVLVNILANAKDALRELSNSNKKIILKIGYPNKEIIRIQIVDNGIGIRPEHLKKIFSYGFTTKKNGHGFGLHTSALAINDMGGTIKVESEGLGKGATFTLELPCHTPKTIF